MGAKVAIAARPQQQQIRLRHRMRAERALGDTRLEARDAHHIEVIGDVLDRKFSHASFGMT
jgi:hypothetical protein